MAELNKVLIMGNLTRDVELRYTTTGSAVARLGMALNRRYRTAQGEDREEVCFVDVDVWGRQAETCHQYLRKGAPAFVEGRLRLDQWEDRQSGQKRSRLLVHAERVQFLGAPRGGEFADQSEGGGHAPAPPAQGGGYAPRPPQGGGYRPPAQQGGGYSQAPAAPRPPGPAPQSSAPPPQQHAPMPEFPADDVGEAGQEDDIPF